MTRQLELRDVTVNYGALVAADDISLVLEAGEIGCLLGPSGCGKTTLLRAIAGFEPLAAGEIRLHGRRISEPGHSLPPEQRRVGMVFQDFALFPHLSVRRNVAFGLGAMPAPQRRRRVLEMLELVGLAALADRYPHELSGGQQQRVALARALAPEPEILLLDEPFSSLDSQLREQRACEVRELRKRNGVTAGLVTHDQQEAFAMADRIALLQAGRLAQLGSPQDLYRRPADEFVARFLGQGSVVTIGPESRLLGCGLGLENALALADRAAIRVLVRPECVQHCVDGPLRLELVSRTFHGARYHCELALEDGQRLRCFMPAGLDCAVGDPVPVRIDPNGLVVFAA